MDTTKIPRFQSFGGEKLKRSQMEDVYDYLTKETTGSCNSESLSGYLCTRDVGHEGPHCASAGTFIVAIWD
jgi:hypothetical protein